MRPSVFRSSIALRHNPIHYLPIQLIPGLSKSSHHRRHLGIPHLLPYLKPPAGNNPLITAAHQPSIQANHHLHCRAVVFALKRL